MTDALIRKRGKESGMSAHRNTGRLMQKDLQASLGYTVKTISKQNMTEKQGKKGTR